MKIKILNLISLITTIILLYFYFLFAIAIIFLIISPIEIHPFANSLMFPLYISILITFYVFFISGISIKPKYYSYLTKLAELNFIIPIFILSLGFFLLFLSLVYSSISTFLEFLGDLFLIVGLGIFIIIFFAKSFLEKRICFTLKKAYEILETASNGGDFLEDNFKRYMRLTFININAKLSRRLEIKTCNDENDYSKLQYSLINYLPTYIEFGDESQLLSTKNHFATMLNFVDKNDKIKWKPFTIELIKLNKDILEYLSDNNFHLTYRARRKELEWIIINKNDIFKTIGIIIALISVYFNIMLN